MAITINRPIILNGSMRVGGTPTSGPIQPVISTTNLLAHWNVGDYTSGSTLNDSSGNGYHATLINSPTYSSANKSLTFNGSNQYATAAHAGLLNLGASWTITAVVRFLRLSGSNSVFSTFENWSSTLRGYSLGLDYVDAGGYCLGTNNLRSYIGTGQFANHIKVSNSNVITTTGWRMVTAVGTNATSNVTVTFYNNGTSIGANTWCAGNTSGAVAYANGTTAVRIASTNAASYKVDYANIELGRILIYNRALSAAEISTMYTEMQKVHAI